MRLNRRAFFHGLAASVATVAIAIRMAPKFPEVLTDGTWRYEMATDKYYYGIDTAKPWNVQIFKKAASFDLDPWIPVDPEDLVQKARAAFVDVEGNSRCVSHQAIEDFGFNEEFLDELEAAQIINISQGALIVQRGGLEGLGVHEMTDMVALPVILTTKADMLAHA